MQQQRPASAQPLRCALTQLEYIQHDHVPPRLRHLVCQGMPCYMIRFVDKVTSREKRQRRILMVTFQRLIMIEPPGMIKRYTLTSNVAKIEKQDFQDRVRGSVERVLVHIPREYDMLLDFAPCQEKALGAPAMDFIKIMHAVRTAQSSDDFAHSAQEPWRGAGPAQGPLFPRAKLHKPRQQNWMTPEEKLKRQTERLRKDPGSPLSPQRQPVGAVPGSDALAAAKSMLGVPAAVLERRMEREQLQQRQQQAAREAEEAQRRAREAEEARRAEEEERRQRFEAERRELEAAEQEQQKQQQQQQQHEQELQQHGGQQSTEDHAGTSPRSTSVHSPHIGCIENGQVQFNEGAEPDDVDGEHVLQHFVGPHNFPVPLVCQRCHVSGLEHHQDGFVTCISCPGTYCCSQCWGSVDMVVRETVERNLPAGFGSPPRESVRDMPPAPRPAEPVYEAPTVPPPEQQPQTGDAVWDNGSGRPEPAPPPSVAAVAPAAAAAPSALGSRQAAPPATPAAGPLPAQPPQPPQPAPEWPPVTWCYLEVENPDPVHRHRVPYVYKRRQIDVRESAQGVWFCVSSRKQLAEGCAESIHLTRIREVSAASADGAAPSGSTFASLGLTLAVTTVSKTYVFVTPTKGERDTWLQWLHRMLPHTQAQELG